MPVCGHWIKKTMLERMLNLNTNEYLSNIVDIEDFSEILILGKNRVGIKCLSVA